MNPSPPLTRRSPGRFLLALGLALPILAALGYAVQFYLVRLSAPWYMPILATIGVALVAFSLWQAGSVWRVLALLLSLLLCGMAWLFLLAVPLPKYTGPLVVGQPFPVFETTRADGTTFTRSEFEGERDTVLVFFRGRW